ncbi:MAG: hypothetical protein HOV96_34960 [Nonomuraea sp.]|nr:hypothetical protein [Nonomuraea sp.]NUP82753.1 hypothetical protein [Nonomuraea sp.]
MKKTLLAAALLTALAGCGGQQSGTGVASVTRTSAEPTAAATPTASADPQEQGRKFAACMREHGVPMEDPDPSGGGGLKMLTGKNVDKEKIRKAAEDCRAYSPFKDRTNLKPEDVEQMRRLAACMRENGVDMPDPNPDGSMPSGTTRNLKPDDPAFKKAIEVCGKKSPILGRTK